MQKAVSTFNDVIVSKGERQRGHVYEYNDVIISVGRQLPIEYIDRN